MENAGYLAAGGVMEQPKPHVELRGTFDGRAARHFLETLQRYAGGETVLLDFRKVDALQDFALALLAVGLSRMPGVRLETRGLPSHSTRLLLYQRIDPHTLGPMPEGRGSEDCSRRRWHDDLDDVHELNTMPV